MTRRHHDRNIQFEAVTYERIKGSASKQAISVSAWIRMAIRHQLDHESTKSEVSQLRDEMAASFTRILDHCRGLSNAQQVGIAIVDSLTKYILSVSPEPGADGQKIGRRRYEQFLKTVAMALEGDGLRAFANLDHDDKNANGAGPDALSKRNESSRGVPEP